MARDIFGRLAQDFGGAFSADAAVVSFAQGAGGLQTGVGLLTQSLNFTYQQRIQRLYELGSRATFYVAGRSEGNGSIARVMGPRPVSLAFYQFYGNVCNGFQTVLQFTVGTGCDVPGDLNAGLTFALTGVVLTSIGMTIQAQDMMINETLQMMFVSMVA